MIVTSGFLPGVKYGGPPISINNFCSLMDNCECYVVAKNHDMGETLPYTGISAGWNDKGNCFVKYLSDENYSKDSFLAALDEIKPDILYLQSLFADCVLPCLSIAKLRNVPVLLAPRGELCPGAMRKKYKKIPYIGLLRAAGLIRNVSFQFTSDDELMGIKRYFGESAKAFALTNVPSKPKKLSQRSKKRVGEIKIAYLSRIVPKKNLYYALSCLPGLCGSVEFNIYGPVEDASYYEKCKSLISTLPSNIKANYCGYVGQGGSHAIFAEHDVFLFPTQSENYGHVIAESLSVGCPVLTSDQTPWTFEGFEAAGRAIPLDMKSKFMGELQGLIDEDGFASAGRRSCAIRYFDHAANYDSLRSRYSDVLLAVKNFDK
nr:glycosyltransferase [Adlercreutzia sp. ZJ473]